MSKYKPFPQIDLTNRTWPNNTIKKEPIWCSVDLRDGNQALQTPMSVDTKIKYFKLLTEIGFKEIEIGFPSASQTEFDYLRKLVDENKIPKNVKIQILCQSREHLIKRSVHSLKGVKNAIFHLYNSTSPLQRKVTFNKSKQEIIDIATKGIEILKNEIKKIPDTKVTLQYSPESFSNTEMDYAVEICNEVYKAWNPKKGEKVIFNLPATVESSTPNIHADQIEWFCNNIDNRDNIIISLHTHNDRGTAIAAAELGILAGADRVEGTLFGNGERTGNLDIVSMALNMFSQGIDIGLDFSNIMNAVEKYKTYTKLPIHPRHPYAGDLVFTAFSGSHQDAIRKGLNIQSSNSKNSLWEVPYLPIDPKDIGRSYEAIIRFNSQSGKGGVAYILYEEYGYDLPKKMHGEVGQIMNKLADKTGKEISSDIIFNTFKDNYIFNGGDLELIDFQFQHATSKNKTGIAQITLKWKNEILSIESKGNGPIDAFTSALKKQNWKNITLTNFHEHSIGTGSNMQAVAYISLSNNKGETTWGCGKDDDISKAGIKALISAFNKLT